MKIYLFLVLVTGIFLLSACPGYVAGEIDTTELPNLEEKSVLFVDKGGGLTVFETNDSRYNGARGYTLWALHGSSVEPFSELNVVVKKNSGYNYAGYGVTFCHGASNGVETMLIVMINTRQEYLIGKVINGDFEEIKAWTPNAFLKLGYSQDNRITVTRDSGGVFTLSLNGQDTLTRFEDTIVPIRSGGRNGYIAVISPRDNLGPDTVRVEFTE
jgi:hypothetical protein